MEVFFLSLNIARVVQSSYALCVRLTHQEIWTLSCNDICAMKSLHDVLPIKRVWSLIKTNTKNKTHSKPRKIFHNFTLKLYGPLGYGRKITDFLLTGGRHPPQSPIIRKLNSVLSNFLTIRCVPSASGLTILPSPPLQLGSEIVHSDDRISHIIYWNPLLDK